MSVRTSTTTRSDRVPAAAAPGPGAAAVRAAVYRYLAMAFSDPSAGAAAALGQQWPLAEAALRKLGLDADAAACGGLSVADDDALMRAHVAVFGHAVSKECPPYGAEYGQAHIFEKTQTLADVAGFYRAFRLDLAEGVRDRPDHIALELEFMEFLCLKQALAEADGHGPERVEFCIKVQQRFLADHLGFWAFSFARRLRCRPEPGPYAAWAALLEAFLVQELSALGLPGHADPFVNEGTVDRVDDSACGACPLAAAGAIGEPVKRRGRA